MHFANLICKFLVLATYLAASGEVFAQAAMHPSSAQPVCRLLTPVLSESVQLALESTATSQLPQAADEFGSQFRSQSPTFRLDSEQAFQAQLRRELPGVKDVQFPMDVPPVRDTKATALFPPASVAPVGAQVCYRPLYFKEPRTERNGDYVPCVQPLLSMSKFYLDAVLLPYHLVARPPWTFECANP